MPKRYLFSDPIYGLIEITDALVLKLIEHLYFQRLRRISQLGFTHYVFSGATHTRFSHALGALHLMQLATQNLQKQGIEISKEEEQAVYIAILLHDIGHAPFSHSLEFQLIKAHHEVFSLALMEQLNQDFDGQLGLAIRIFKDEYPKKFLHQLVSSQLDMDRLDYLTRDSFFTGVQEGIVGYDRIIKMMTVTDEEELILDNKGVYSVENFLVARRSMYWQVYLHKTVLGAGELLIKILERVRHLLAKGIDLGLPESLHYFLSQNLLESDLQGEKLTTILTHYIRLDDTDIWNLLKQSLYCQDTILAYLADALLHRKLFKIKIYEQPLRREQVEKIKQRTCEHFGISEAESQFLVFTGSEANRAYKSGRSEIKVRLRNGQLRPLSKWSEYSILDNEVIKYFIGYPKAVSKYQD